MADLKITQLTQDTAPTSDDLVVTVDAPGSAPTDKKVAIADLFSIFPTMTMARQAIINGGFDVSQRNSPLFSSANPANAGYLIDRWQIGWVNTGTLPTTITHSQQAHTVGDIWGAYYFYRIAPNGAGSGFGVSDNYLIKQHMENGTRFLAGASKKVTVSFWAKTSIAGTVKLGVGMAQNYGSGGSPTAEEALTGTTVTLTSSWAKYTVTFTTNTLAAKTFGTNNDDKLSLFLMQMWGSTIGSTYLGGAAAQTFVGSGNIDISQVQVCAGEVALPYQPKSFNQEAIDCQRYFQKSYQYGDAPGTATTIGQVEFQVPTAGTGSMFRSVQLIPLMRVAPTLTIYDQVGASGKVYKSGNGKTVTTAYVGNSSFTAGTADATNATELTYQYIADAEF